MSGLIFLCLRTTSLRQNSASLDNDPELRGDFLQRAADEPVATSAQAAGQAWDLFVAAFFPGQLGGLSYCAGVDERGDVGRIVR
jgi:hypothetical protein